MKIQRRHQCCVCGQDVAVDKYDHASIHGYTKEYGFFNGRCWGSSKAHWGTKAGYELAKKHLNDMKELYSNLSKKYQPLVDASPPYGIPNFESALERQGYYGWKSLDRFINMLEKRLVSWKQSEPYERKIK